MDIEECIKLGYISRVRIEKDLVLKELKESEYDLQAAKKAFNDGDFKWSIVKNYYSMFHAARALLFSMGLKERRHFAVSVVLEQLNKQGKIESEYIAAFHSAMSAREDADYRYTYSQETASVILEAAQNFDKKIRTMINSAGGRNFISLSNPFTGVDKGRPMRALILNLQARKGAG